MITITNKRFNEIKSQGFLPDDLREKNITIIMPKKAAQDWLKALRSGEFIQANGYLNDPHTGGFCCLGVQQYCQLKGNIEVDTFGEYLKLPTYEYLDENGIIYVDSYNSFINNPHIHSKNDDAASLNDMTDYKQVKVNQHASKEVIIFNNDFKRMADLLEACMAVY